MTAVWWLAELQAVPSSNSAGLLKVSWLETGLSAHEHWLDDQYFVGLPCRKPLDRAKVPQIPRPYPIYLACLILSLLDWILGW
jgi:hypothetical protein